MSGIAAWLREHSLAQYVELFQQNAIDIDVLEDLTEADMRELGLPLGDRKRLMRAIGTGNNQPADVAKDGRASTQIEIVAPCHLSKQVLRSKAALEGERKQVTVMFADIEGSTRIIQDMDSEDAANLLRTVVKEMMAAVHQYEGTVNKVLGDGIMAIFGAPIAHEDHAIRACYSALSMQTRIANLSLATRRDFGVDVRVRQGLNSGDVIVRAINNDLTMDYDAIGPTVHLAGRMEQTARAGTCRLSLHTYRLAKGFVEAESLGPIPIRGVDQPVDVFELQKAVDIRSRFLASQRGRLTRFVGRDSEMTALERVWAAVQRGRGQTLSVVGEAGVGKSRLFYEFVHGQLLRDVLVLESGSVSHARASAFRPLVDLLKAYLGIDPGDDVRRMREKTIGKLMALSETLSDLSIPILALIGAPVEEPEWAKMDPAQRRRSMLDACRTLLFQEAEVQPLVIVFEDLHWIDQETQAFLELLVDGVASTQILLLFNYRPEYNDRWVGRANYTHIRIDPLPPDNGEEMLDDLLGASAELKPLRKLLMERTEGYPFFIEETVQTLVEENVLTGDRGAYRMAVPLQRIQVPATVQSVLGARIDRLPPDAKQLLQTSAVIGKDFELPLLKAVSTRDESTIAELLAALQVGEFVYESRMFPEPEYTFKHALTHQVAYEGLLAAQRRDRHAEVLSAMESIYRDSLQDRRERLMHHAALGEDWEAVHKHGMQAGHHALEISANQSAVESFEHVLDALGKLEDTPERLRDGISTRFALRDAKYVLGQTERIEALMEEARSLATRLDDKKNMVEILLYQSGNEWAFGRVLSAAELAREALILADESEDERLMGLARYRLTTAAMMSGDYGDAARAGVAGFELLRPYATTLMRFGGLACTFIGSFTAVALAELGRFEEAEKIGSEAYETACSVGHAYSISVSCFGIGHAALLRGDAERAVAPLEEGLRQIEVHAVGATVPWVSGRAAYAFALSGRMDEIDPLIEMTANEAASHFTASMMHPMAFVWLARACLSIGRIDDAAKFAAIAGKEIPGADVDGAVLAWAHWLDAEIARLGARDVTAANASIDKALAAADQRGMRPLRAHCLATQGMLLADSKLTSEAAQLADQLGMERLAGEIHTLSS